MLDANSRGACEKDGRANNLRKPPAFDHHRVYGQEHSPNIPGLSSVDEMGGCSRWRGYYENSLSTARALLHISPTTGELLDMICVGFGPASLAIAIALADAFCKGPYPLPNVLFLEKQAKFAWHSGMQLPSAKMQISFLKDLATPRDPTSPFSFINYLHSKGRFSQFVNMNTFLPTRYEYEDYMRWCAAHFEGVVKYGSQVHIVKAENIDLATQRVQSFEVSWKNLNGTHDGYARARHVIIAAGGEPCIPAIFKPFAGKITSSDQLGHVAEGNGSCVGDARQETQRVSHSSEYARIIGAIEMVLHKSLSRDQAENTKGKLGWERSAPDTIQQANGEEALQMQATVPPPMAMQREARDQVDLKTDFAKKEMKYGTYPSLGTRRPRFAVIGAGQSAAEVFSDLSARFPAAEVTLIIKDTALRPSDDSPFVNDVFDPERVDDIFNQTPSRRESAIAQDRATNYGVVRPELLERMYEQMYMQRIGDNDPSTWRCKILRDRQVICVEESTDGSSLRLLLASARSADGVEEQRVVEGLECDHVFVATGYVRKAHEDILKGTTHLLPAGLETDGFRVGRDYRVLYDEEKVANEAGIWLQGCNEKTHGLSDTLLSILAVRGGEIVKSIFHNELAWTTAARESGQQCLPTDGSAPQGRLRGEMER